MFPSSEWRLWKALRSCSYVGDECLAGFCCALFFFLIPDEQNILNSEVFSAKPFPNTAPGCFNSMKKKKRKTTWIGWSRSRVSASWLQKHPLLLLSVMLISCVLHPRSGLDCLHSANSLPLTGDVHSLFWDVGVCIGVQHFSPSDTGLSVLLWV